jgi:hypothetical protein
MKSINENILNENISDETIKDVYKNTFSKAGVTLKDFTIDRDKVNKVTYFHFTLPLGIHFWIKWPSGVDVAYSVSVVNGEQSEPETIYNPNAISLVESVVAGYKKLIKRQNLLKQLISLILENDKDANQNPLIK